MKFEIGSSDLRYFLMSLYTAENIGLIPGDCVLILLPSVFATALLH